MLPVLHVMISPRSPGYGWTAQLLNNEPFGVGFSADGPSPVGLTEKIRAMAEQHVKLNGPCAIAEYPPDRCVKCGNATPITTSLCWNCRPRSKE